MADDFKVEATPIDPARFCIVEPDGSKRADRDYVLMAMTPVFAAGIAGLSGFEVHPAAMAAAGILSVAQYWVEYQLPCCNEDDMLDAALDVGGVIAALIFPKHGADGLVMATNAAQKAYPNGAPCDGPPGGKVVPLDPRTAHRMAQDVGRRGRVSARRLLRPDG